MGERTHQLGWEAWLRLRYIDVSLQRWKNLRNKAGEWGGGGAQRTLGGGRRMGLLHSVFYPVDSGEQLGRQKGLAGCIGCNSLFPYLGDRTK